MQYKFYKEFLDWYLSHRVQYVLFDSQVHSRHKKALAEKYASIIAFLEVSHQQIL